MNKIYSKILVIALSVFGLNANAQCTGCTQTIAGNDASNYLVGSGQVLCISSTGNATGMITVTSGGILCNQGSLNSTNVSIVGGILKNYGTINTGNILISAAGTYSNFATSIIDSLFVTQNSSKYVNQGTQVINAFAIADNANATNTGTITTNLFYDSLATFTNNGTISVTDMMGLVYSSNFTNNGSLTVTNDFGHGYNSTFLNNGYMKVNRDFYNGNSSTFTTYCMMLVSRDWYNAATVNGPTLTSCGGFSITGISLNSGTVGSITTHVDICDAGMPGTGVDSNSGTIASTTSYCTCTNTCVTTVGIKEIPLQSSVLISNIFPNPASSSLTIDLNNKDSESLSIEIRDMMGRTVLTKTLAAKLGENQTEINVSALAQGSYILCVTDSHQLQTKRLFNVSK